MIDRDAHTRGHGDSEPWTCRCGNVISSREVCTQFGLLFMLRAGIHLAGDQTAWLMPPLCGFYYDESPQKASTASKLVWGWSLTPFHHTRHQEGEVLERCHHSSLGGSHQLELDLISPPPDADILDRDYDFICLYVCVCIYICVYFFKSLWSSVADTWERGEAVSTINHLDWLWQRGGKYWFWNHRCLQSRYARVMHSFFFKMTELVRTLMSENLYSY